MINYIIGKISYIHERFLIIDSNWIGYIVNIANSKDFEINTTKKVYIYQRQYLDNKNSLTNEMYGFCNWESKQFFLNLLNIPQIGPKTAIQIMKNSIKLLQNLIVENNIDELSCLPNMNQKLAKNICEYLAKKYQKIDNIEENDKKFAYKELLETLQTMGYLKQDIENSVQAYQQNFNVNDDLSDALAECIKWINNQKKVISINKS